MVNKKALHQRRKQKKLAEWKINLVAKFKIKASNSSADIQLGVNKYINALDSKIKENQESFEIRGRIGDGSWKSIGHELNSAWILIKSATYNATSKVLK